MLFRSDSSSYSLRAQIYFYYENDLDCLNINNLKLHSLPKFRPQNPSDLKGLWPNNGGFEWGYAHPWSTAQTWRTGWEVYPLMIQVNGSDEFAKRVGRYVHDSDRRLKTNIQRFNRKLDIVKKMNPVYFTWKDSSSNDYGFIAQELEELMPCIIRDETDDNGEVTKIYNHDAPLHFIPILTKAIQDLDEDKNKEIEELKNRILALEGENVTLKNQMNDVLTRLSAAGL